MRTIISEFKVNNSLVASAQTSNPKVFKDIFAKTFNDVTLDCFDIRMEGFESLMTNDAKRERISKVLSGEIYRIFRSHYPNIETEDLEAAEPEI